MAGIKPQLVEYDAIVGLSRGGLVPAVELSHYLNIPMYIADISHPDSKGDNINQHKDIIPDVKEINLLVVDDILDSGWSVKSLIERMNINHKYSFHVAALFAKQQALGLLFKNHGVDIVYGELVEDDGPFICFPWEIAHN
jgi:hypoxanthine phosphoribosyltransferase